MYQKHKLPQIPYICHTCQLFHVQMWDKYVSIYKSYELNTSEWWPGALVCIHFTLLAYAPKQFACQNAHICLQHFYCSLHSDPTLLYISKKKKINKLQHLHLPSCYKICATNKYAPQLHKICHMPYLFLVYLWGKYADIYATYKYVPLMM